MPQREHCSIATFQHHRLSSPRSIRLLILQSSASLSDPLIINLLETSLDEFPSSKSTYEALSYVWGATAGSIPCICEGRQLLITPSCNDALRHLRLPTQQRTLWVDAICIDQGDSKDSLKERNTQITLMGDVYRTAQRTLCWLGKGEEYTAGMFERLHRIASCPSKRELRKLLVYDAQLRQNGQLETGSTCLNHIFCHSWHSRIWTVQEVAFSTDCQVICGNQAISWDSYIIAAKFLIYDEFIHELDAQAWKNHLSIIIRDDLRKYLISAPSEGKDDGTVAFLTSDLAQVRHLEATNPKDKIYGLYAAFSTLGISLPAPDYAKPLEQIYEEACIAIIFHSGSLQVLAYASSNARDQNLPSWVTDWHDKDVILNNLPAHATDGSRISQSSLSELSPARGQLCVRGQVIGLITTRAEYDFATLELPSSSLPILKEPRYNFSNEVDTLRLLVHRVRLFREWMRLTDEVPPSYLNEDFSSAFQKLATFDSESLDAPLYNTWISFLEYPNTAFDLSNGERLAETWKSADKANAHHWTTELFQCSVVAAALVANASSMDSHAPLEIAAELLDFTARISGNMGNRALILVHDNLLNVTLPGTAFHMAMVGDAVVLVEGADYPVVLRQKDDKWSFVGPAFIVGIMDGEAWPDEDEGFDKLQDFVLT